MVPVQHITQSLPSHTRPLQLPTPPISTRAPQYPYPTQSIHSSTAPFLSKPPHSPPPSHSHTPRTYPIRHPLPSTTSHSPAHTRSPSPDIRTPNSPQHAVSFPRRPRMTEIVTKLKRPRGRASGIRHSVARVRKGREGRCRRQRLLKAAGHGSATSSIFLRRYLRTQTDETLAHLISNHVISSHAGEQVSKLIRPTRACHALSIPYHSSPHPRTLRTLRRRSPASLTAVVLHPPIRPTPRMHAHPALLYQIQVAQDTTWTERSAASLPYKRTEANGSERMPSYRTWRTAHCAGVQEAAL